MAITNDSLKIPEQIRVLLDKSILTIKGEKGEVKKNLFNTKVSIKAEGNEIQFLAKSNSKTTKKIINTFKAHIQNMIKGATEGHIYKLRICSGHFPMSVSIKGEELEVKNFIGEKVPRKLKLNPNAKVTIDGSEIIVESINKETAGQAAASIEQLTRRPGFDNRIFQDGIYIIEKDGKELK